VNAPLIICFTVYICRDILILEFHKYATCFQNKIALSSSTHCQNVFPRFSLLLTTTYKRFPVFGSVANKWTSMSQICINMVFEAGWQVTQHHTIRDVLQSLGQSRQDYKNLSRASIFPVLQKSITGIRSPIEVQKWKRFYKKDASSLMARRRPV